MGVSKTNTIENILKKFCTTLTSWIICEEEVQLIDPFETEYGENYSPATSAVLYAYLYTNTRQEEYYNYCSILIERCVFLCSQKKVSPFCKVFLIHYSLMAIYQLPEFESRQMFSKHEDFYLSFKDVCGQINTNCAALQWGNEIFIKSLSGLEIDVKYSEYLLKHISKAQNSLGFINDAVSDGCEVEDGMPIAYHLFTIFILISVINTVKPGSNEKLVYDIIHKGISWISNIIATDGSFATLGRSSNQIFTWGCMLAILKYCNISNNYFERVLNSWLNYEQLDGSYSCTPNYLPHELRIGFEKYTHVNMYNTLAMVGLVISERITGAKDIDINLSDINFVDENSGYIFYRNEKSNFGCSLRTHSQGYTHSMQGFHYRINGHRFPIPEPRMNNENILESVYEGYLIQDTSGMHIYPDQKENANYKFNLTGVDLEVDDSSIHCLKSIRISDDEIEWIYKITAKKDLISCQHIVPILVYDGKNGARFLKRSENTINVFFDGYQYQLTCNRSVHSNVSLNRSYLSPSGVSSVIPFKIASNIKAGQTIEWRTAMKRFNKDIRNASLQQKIAAKDIIPRIRKVTFEKEKTTVQGTPVRFLIEAEGEELRYAWYLYKNNERIEVVWYSEKNIYEKILLNAGKYQVRVFVRDKYGNQISELISNVVEV